MYRSQRELRLSPTSFKQGDEPLHRWPRLDSLAYSSSLSTPHPWTGPTHPQYTSHAKEQNLPLPSLPVLFNRPPTALNDPYPASVVIPHMFADGADYEAEVAVIIGRDAKDVKEEDALDHVAG